MYSKKAAVQAMAGVAGERSSGIRSEPASWEPKLGGPALKQPTFDWGSAGKYI